MALVQLIQIYSPGLQPGAHGLWHSPGLMASAAPRGSWPLPLPGAHGLCRSPGLMARLSGWICLSIPQAEAWGYISGSLVRKSS
ncbi:MAG: hypothetical protein PHV14_09385, partial [Bacteroidales bacterium]|nr:hypothetical protein [Bacteroidales bacterium]